MTGRVADAVTEFSSPITFINRRDLSGVVTQYATSELASPVAPISGLSKEQLLANPTVRAKRIFLNLDIAFFASWLDTSNFRPAIHFRSAYDTPDHLPTHIREPERPSLEFVRQLLV